MNTNLKEITNFLAINENLGTAGMPQESQLEEIANAGYQVVINLALSESPGAINNEAQILSSYGIRYIHIPVVWEKPDLASLKNFLQTMDECATQKVLVHCVLNMRVSIFVYLYRLLRLAVSAGKCLRKRTGNLGSGHYLAVVHSQRPVGTCGRENLG